MQTEAKRLFYQRNRKRLIQRSMEYKRKFPVESAVRATKSNAKTRDLEYTLDDRHAADLVTDHCFYCGTPPAPANGIDRVDNARGYVEDNVVSCCRMCNIAKNSHPLDSFVSWIRRAHAHQQRYFDA